MERFDKRPENNPGHSAFGQLGDALRTAGFRPARTTRARACKPATSETHIVRTVGVKADGSTKFVRERVHVRVVSTDRNDESGRLEHAGYNLVERVKVSKV